MHVCLTVVVEESLSEGFGAWSTAVTRRLYTDCVSKSGPPSAAALAKSSPCSGGRGRRRGKEGQRGGVTVGVHPLSAHSLLPIHDYAFKVLLMI